MSILEVIRTMYEYNEWADDLVLAQIPGLTDQELMAPRGVSHNSIGMDLLHLVGAQVGWLAIWQGRGQRTPLPTAASGRFEDSLRDWFARSHRALSEFIASLSEERALGKITLETMPYLRRQGQPETFRAPLWHYLLHVVNHSTQHRAEIGAALAALGRSPGDLDLGHFAAERALR